MFIIFHPFMCRLAVVCVYKSIARRKSSYVSLMLFACISPLCGEDHHMCKPVVCVYKSIVRRRSSYVNLMLFVCTSPLCGEDHHMCKPVVCVYKSIAWRRFFR